MTQMVKNQLAMETQVHSLRQDNPLQKGTTINSSIFAWEIPWTEEPGGLQSMGLQKVGHNWVTSTSLGSITHQKYPFSRKNIPEV